MTAMMPPIIDTEAGTLLFNDPIYGTHGEFTLSSEVKVPYFVALMDLERLTTELKTHEEISPSLNNVYTLVELFQRTINIDRVRDDIVKGYLNVRSKLKFFNSLTVALIPKDVTGHTAKEFIDYPNQDPAIPTETNKEFDIFFNDERHERVAFGGVQYVKTASAGMARLRWDAKRVDAVAVDGQHRLAALKLWMTSRNNVLSATEKPTRVPIIFLLLNEKVGFKSANTGHGIKAIAREIFTDLNKNAKEVDFATQIVLDDRSVESCCVRALVTESTCTDSDTRLPLSLLRWQETNNRFDQRYYLNSLVNLHLLVEDLISLPTPKDTMSKSEVLTFIKVAEQSLGIGKPRELKVSGVSLKEYYESIFLDAESGEPVAPFNAIPAQYIGVAVKGFESNFAPWLLNILTKFHPYKELLSYARANDLIAGVFSQYQSQPQSHQVSLKADMEQLYGGEGWKSTVIDPHVLAIEKIKGLKGDPKGEQWAFKTVFQKALVRLAKALFFESAQDEVAKFGSVEDFILFFSSLHTADILRVTAPMEAGDEYLLWTFIAINYGNPTVKVSKATEERIEHLLNIWYLGWRLSKSLGKVISPLESENSITPAAILKEFSARSSQSAWPGAYDSFAKLVETFSDNAYIIKKVTSTDIKPEVKKKVSMERMLSVVSKGLLNGPSP